MKRRDALIGALTVTVTSQLRLTAAPTAYAQSRQDKKQQSNGGPFTLPDLPYRHGALAPAIGARTMRIHHQRHHGAYVENLNKEVATYPELADRSLEDIMANISKYNAAVRNNGGGHYNHSAFWKMMAPARRTGKPSPELKRALGQTFGSLKEFRTAFGAAATTRFGSGWAWLILNPEGKLAVTSTPNQDNPLMDVVEQRGTPLLALDVWEHAYYLDYQNLRADYIKRWWSVVNWRTVNKLYADATAG